MLVYHFEGVPRRPLAVALKNILTLGIHTKVWLYRVNREMDGHEGFHVDFRWLGTMVALPIITPIVVKFQTARRMDRMVAHQLTLGRIRPRALGWISIVPILGSGFYAYWVQHTLNRHWFWHRREEEIRLAKERIKRLEGSTDPKDAERVDACRQEIATLEAEIAAELEAAKVRLGEGRFEERRRIADEYASMSKVSRKDLAEMRKARKARRKGLKAKGKDDQAEDADAPEADKAAQKAKKPKRAKKEKEPKRAKQRLPAKIPTDADGQPIPETPLPDRMPEDILLKADEEERPLTDEEEAEIKAAEKLLAAREKELKRLRKALIKQRKAEAKEEKAHAKAEAKKAKQKPKKGKRSKTAAGKAKVDKKRGDSEGKAKAEPPPKGIPVKQKPGKPAPTASAQEAGPLKVLSLKCPRCAAAIDNVAKRGDAPAKVTCPECGLVGKV